MRSSPSFFVIYDSPSIILYFFEKALYPEITLTVVGNNNAKELMDACPFVDEYFTYDKSLKDTLFLIRKLWKSDAVYLMDTLYRISTVYAMARIKIRVYNWLISIIHPWLYR